MPWLKSRSRRRSEGCRRNRWVILYTANASSGGESPMSGVSVNSHTSIMLDVRQTTHGISSSGAINSPRSTVCRSVREKSGEKERTAIDNDALRHAEHHLRLSAQDAEDAVEEPSTLSSAVRSRRRLSSVHHHQLIKKHISSYVYVPRIP
jgi:hypothetical protein